MFEIIIEKLSNPPVLAIADYGTPFKLHMGTSSSGLGAVLYQHQDAIDRVMAYASRALKPVITDKYHNYL